MAQKKQQEQEQELREYQDYLNEIRSKEYTGEYSKDSTQRFLLAKPESLRDVKLALDEINILYDDISYLLETFVAINERDRRERVFLHDMLKYIKQDGRVSEKQLKWIFNIQERRNGKT